MKVAYVKKDGYQSQAYLNEEPLDDGTYTGVNKHTDTPVHLRPWNHGWVTVCERESTFNIYKDDFDTEPADPNCSCAGRS